MTKLLTLKEFKSGLEYHDELNPKLWDEREHLHAEVKAQLDIITQHFVSFLKMDTHLITDIVITGSNCNFNYSPLSDIDLHVVADFDPDAKNGAGVSVLDGFNAAKTLYNTTHHLSIHGIPIEVYVQPTSEHFTSNAGVYSLKHQQWLQHPVKQVVDLDNREIERKATPIMQEIDRIVDGKLHEPDRIKHLKTKIKQLRAAGLEAGGEYGVQNLAFKAIRNDGYLEKLSNYADGLTDELLSLA